jgi:hypothetical protein
MGTRVPCFTSTSPPLPLTKTIFINIYCLTGEQYLSVDIHSDGKCSSGGWSGGTNATQETVESAMPITPTEDEVPSIAYTTKGREQLSFARVLFSADGSDEEEEEEKEGEEEDHQLASGSHDGGMTLQFNFSPLLLPPFFLMLSASFIHHSCMCPTKVNG